MSEQDEQTPAASRKSAQQQVYRRLRGFPVDLSDRDKPNFFTRSAKTRAVASDFPILSGNTTSVLSARLHLRSISE